MHEKVRFKLKKSKTIFTPFLIVVKLPTKPLGAKSIHPNERDYK
jgi:hypothetical protein